MILIVWRLEPESAEGQLGSMAAENTMMVTLPTQQRKSKVTTVFHRKCMVWCGE